MKQNLVNPFADYGTIVHGERFIGRKNELEVIDGRVLRPQEPGNLAIIGDSRIGKSSLVYRAVIDRKEELMAKRLLPIWLNLSNYDRSLDFFRSLVSFCVDELEEKNWLSADIQQTAISVLNDELSWGECYSRIQRFFKKVRQEGIKILFILDEFDHARHLFRGNISAFQGLRELAYRPEWRVYYIVVSRRTIREIELQTKAISTFDGIFHKHYLRMFDDSDINEYFGRLAFLRIHNDISLRKQILFYCGGHPFLLEMFGYEIFEIFRNERTVDIDKAAHRLLPSLLNQYERMIELLREEDILSKILQILIGPVVDLKWSDLEKLLNYGFIKQGNQFYVAFSKHFQAYLEIIERQFEWEFWPIWRQTEKALRQLIFLVMVQKYGENWIEILEKLKPHLKNIFNRCLEAQAREEKSFGNQASRDLLDYTYPGDLFTILFAEWSSFKDILGKDTNYWTQRQQLLSKIRNPLAHNRGEIIPSYELQVAEGYCKEILEKIKAMVALQPT